MAKYTIEQRRKLAEGGSLPPALASKFPTAQLAVLCIVSEETARRGVCDLCLDEIAARAGTSRTTAQSALREAKRLGVITVQERRHRGRPSATNLIQWTEERPPLDLRPAGVDA
jgi:hypothetical protein